MSRLWQFWLGFFLVVGFTYATRGILLPFVVGFAVAYLLDPLADKLEARKFPRWLAATVILLIFFVGVVGFFVALLPVLQVQLSGFTENLPRYLATLKPLVDDILGGLASSFGADLPASADDLVGVAVEKGLANAGNILVGFFTQGVAIFSLLTLLLISPVVAFFLLRDWDLIIARIDSLLPKAQAETIRLLARRIDNALSGFVHGQTMVALIMAALYAFGWSLAGLDYALVLGLLAGVLAFVPIVGAIFAMLIAMLLGFGQFGLDGAALAPVFGVFVIVQIIEGAVLTPRIIGGKVGLHPVWVLFAIFAGGEVMGFVGMLIALPVAAAVGVIVRFVIEKYLESDLHSGDDRGSRGGAQGRPADGT